VAPDPGFDATAKPWTPLEQAVHDLIGEFTERTTTREHGDPVETPAPSELTAVHAVDSFNAFNAVAQVPTGDPAPSRVAPTAATHAALPIQLPEPPANPSHVHLVVDDGPERVVVTVAMRGNDVHVALRSSDDSTTAALARNAASLDHAMRARGLALGEFTTERELPQQSRHHQPEPEPQERRKPDAEPFELEETP
jgi:hypothetical protein